MRCLARKLIRISLLLLTLISLIPWLTFVPVPVLTEPEGNFSVGTKIFRWTDPARYEKITEDPYDKRNVIVQAWYPTYPKTHEDHSKYLDGLGNLPSKVGIIPGILFENYDQINTFAITNARLNNTQKKWPVIFFLTGYGGSRSFYTSLLAGLASHGYVVLAIDHPYEASITKLTDGSIATTIENFSSKDPDRIQFMKNRMDIRLADINFVLDKLEELSVSDTFFDLLDKTRIAIIGHSLGGATAAVSMAKDKRITAAVNIDGTLYGQLPKQGIQRPFLIVESNKNNGNDYQRYEEGNKKLVQQFSGGYRIELRNADHYSFTDVPLFLYWPSRMFIGRYLGFGNAPGKTHIATINIVNSFLDKVFAGNHFCAEDIIGDTSNFIIKEVP